MGFFSWLDCVTKEQIKRCDEVYVLIPEGFTDKYGTAIGPVLYDGFGHFGRYDIYELLAEWNRDQIVPEMMSGYPLHEKYSGLWDYEKESLRRKGKNEDEILRADEEKREENYQNACRRWRNELNRMMDYHDGLSHSNMVSKYGKEYLREIGIDISENKLLYPIKITHYKDAVYKNCRESLIDPEQGCQ